MKYPILGNKHACAVGKRFSRLAEFAGQNVYMVKYMYSSRLSRARTRKGELPHKTKQLGK